MFLLCDFGQMYVPLDFVLLCWQLLGRRRTIELRRAGYNTELSAPLDNIPFSTSSERERIEETVCLYMMHYCQEKIVHHLLSKEA